MRKLNIILGMVFVLAFTLSCEKEQTTEVHNPLSESLEFQQIPDFIPAATVELIDYSYFKKTSSTRDIIEIALCLETLSPSSLTTTLEAGESVVEMKEVCLEGLPSQGDILFVMDVSGSMGEELSNLQVNSINIMNAIAISIPNSEFGLVSHSDYVDNYAYRLDQAITNSTSNVESAINNLTLSDGGDFPESYARVLYESYSDASLNWRSGSAKVIVFMLDAVPHNPDPGRDGVLGTIDDLIMDDIIAEMVAQNIKLIVLNSGTTGGVWQGYAETTGGSEVQINSNGTIPGGENVEDLITGLIEDSVSTISTLTLKANPSTYDFWLTDLSPAVYINLDLTENVFNNSFDLTLTVPEGTENGLYEFSIDLVGDGAIYGTQTVAITVDSIDRDKDGCLNEEDPHPSSNTSSELSIDGCYPGVENKFITPCTTMMDKIEEVIEGVWAKNNSPTKRRNFDPQRQFQNDMSNLLNSWYRRYDALVTDAEKFEITKCVRRSRIFEEPR